MTRSWTTRLLVVAVGLSLIGLAAGARNLLDPDGPRRGGEQNEVLLGGYHCGVSFEREEAFTWLNIETSGDILQDSPGLYRSHASASLETCDALNAALSETAAHAGCAVGPVERYEDEDGGSREFRFVCEAARSRLVSLIARLSGQVLTETPPS